MSESEPLHGGDWFVLVMAGIGGSLAIGLVGVGMMALAGIGASVGDEDNPVYAFLSLGGIVVMVVGWFFLFRWLFRLSKTPARAGSAGSTAAAQNLHESTGHHINLDGEETNGPW